jgi:ATP-dependent Clp protease ATP-binding subunit ClpC
MTHARSHAELVTLRKIAQELASQRKERMTSVHLLAAIASEPGPASELLRDRRLDAEGLLKASRSFDDEGADPIGRAMGAAREMAQRGPLPEPSAVHLLLALLADRGSAAHRSLVQSGVDLARLRAAAMQMALGVVAARRTSSSASSGIRRTTKSESPPAPSGVAVQLFPPPSKRAPLRPSSPPAPAKPASAQPMTPQPVMLQPGQALEQSAADPQAHPMAQAQPAMAVPASKQERRPVARRGAAESPGPASRYALDRARFPVLSTVGKNLTLAAAEGKLEGVVGREAEIDHALDILAKRHANSPCLVGPAGVGKTSIARGLAHRLVDASDEAPGGPRVLIEIVPSELIAGTGTRGALAERMAAIRAEVREAGGRVILFVDEVHELFESSAFDEATAEIKLALARGELVIVGATRPDEYRKSIETDQALARRFTPIEIEEPAEEEAFLLLQRVAVGLGEHHGLTYEDEALAAAVAWSMRYLPGRALPDKAISILDLAGARARRRAARGPKTVGPRGVAEVMSELADLPVERLLETDRERMLNLEKILAEQIVGHSAALARIARVLRRNAAGLRGRRPIGTFLLLGPTGVGKTETAKAVAEALFHSPDAMTRLDLSEYAEAHAVARLVGAPPGYVGHESGGQLTEAVRRRPYQVILLDEIEKAHRDVLEAFLQVFDEGRMTDGRGRRVDFTNTVIVLTSNLGAAEVIAMRSERAVGFSRASASSSPSRAGEVMIAAARSALPPELYNRIDEVLCFEPLSRSDVAEIARRQLDALGASLAQRGVRLEVEPEAIDVLLSSGGYDATLGARPMKRTIGRLIEAPLAEMILRGEVEAGAVALVGVEQGEILIDAVTARRERAASA